MFQLVENWHRAISSIESLAWLCNKSLVFVGSDVGDPVEGRSLCSEFLGPGGACTSYSDPGWQPQLWGCVSDVMQGESPTSPGLVTYQDRWLGPRSAKAEVLNLWVPTSWGSWMTLSQGLHKNLCVALQFITTSKPQWHSSYKNNFMVGESP